MTSNPHFVQKRVGPQHQLYLKYLQRYLVLFHINHNIELQQTQNNQTPHHASHMHPITSLFFVTTTSFSKYNSMSYDHYYCTEWQPIFPTLTPDLNCQSSIPINSGLFLSVYEINVAVAEPYIRNKYWDQPVPKTASQVDPQKPITYINIGNSCWYRCSWPERDEKYTFSCQLHPQNIHLIFPTMVLGPTRRSVWGCAV